MDFFARQANPSSQWLVFREGIEDGLIGSIGIVWIAGEGRPAKWTTAFAEQRPNILRDETRDAKCVVHARFCCLGPDVVAVLESYCPPALHLRSEERRVGKECRSRWAPYD